MTYWSAVLPDDLAAGALDLVTNLAGPADRPLPRCLRPDLAAGGPGLALAHHQLDLTLPGRGWGRLATGCLEAAARGAQRLGTSSPSLFGGLAGLALTAWTLSPGTAALPTVHDRVTNQATARAEALHAALHDPANQPGLRNDRAHHGQPVRTFDVINGLTGTGAYLLLHHQELTARTALRTVLTTLVALCGAGDAPHWQTPVWALDDADLRTEFPHGLLNCGLAHGIPGPLAMMCLALEAGINVPGQRAAARSTATWLANHRTDDLWGPNWPGRASPPDQPGPANSRTARASWCYGSPGVARALWLAGRALDDPGLRDLAVEAMKSTYRRPAAHRRIDNTPGLCHGLAGLLHITTRFAYDTGCPQFADAAADITQRLLDPRTTLPSGEPGFLDGAAGVVLALLAAATNETPTWYRALLLA
ncbi:lanthionine synthetase C family protein [Streptomyces sp. NPDC101227]|uniref:lanthionine synthetase C family protein n=1 Tax=Streptomyces sp. NPDC101227 TaxID=3366136 RepID=UPI00380951A7